MPIDTGVFGNDPCFEQRYIADYSELKLWVEHMRALHPDISIVLTSGTFDLYHIGHARYLQKARESGDLLIVGVDSDAKTKARKGPHRPVIPERERLELLVHDRSVDIVTLKDVDHKHWQLVETVRPDILVVTDETYDSEQVAEIEQKFGCKVIVLEPQAQSSTSNQIRMLNLGFANSLKEVIVAGVPDFVDSAIERATGSTAGKQVESG